MSKLRSLFALGFLSIILPVTGFPSSWKAAFSAIIGALVCLLTFLHYREMKNGRIGKAEEHKQTRTFVESAIPADSDSE